MLYQIDVVRFITVYIAQGGIAAVFLIIAYLILKRDKKRLNVIFSGVYISSSFGLLLNFIYFPITDEAVVLILNFFTNYFIAFGLIFLPLFDLILLKSEKIITTTKQLAIILGYAVLLLFMITFLVIPGAGVDISAETGWRPVYSLPFYLYIMITISIPILSTIYLSLKINKKFEDDLLKKKWKYFLIGVIELFIFAYAIFTSNYLNISLFRTIIGVIGLILTISGGYLCYYGVGRQIEHD
jgi:hypothetical protein